MAQTPESSQQSSVCSGDVGLAEEDAALRVDPGGENRGGRVVEVGSQGPGLMWRR